MLLIINNFVTDIETGRREMAELGHLCRGIAGLDFTVKHFREINAATLQEIPGLQAVISGGYYDAYETFDLEIFHGEHELIRAVPVPFLGICGGMQHLVLAYGGSIRRVNYGNEEKGFHTVFATRPSALIEGLADEFVVWQNHYCEAAELPAELEVFLSSRKCPVQAVKLKGKAVFGVQFHPEKFSWQYPAGRTILQNFFSLCEGLPVIKSRGVD